MNLETMIMKLLGKKNNQKGKYHYQFKVISELDTYEVEVDSNLSNANLGFTKVWDAYIEKADLRGANLTGIDLRSCNYEGAIFDDGYVPERDYEEIISR